MLVIRLARGGRKKYPVYRIVSADKRRAATGKFIDVLGHYNPHSKELVLKQEEITQLVKNGAQPSDAVLRLMKKDGMELPKWAEITTRNRKPKKEPELVEEKTPVADQGEVSDAPADAPVEVEPANVEVASEAAEAKEEVAAENHNIDTAEAETPTEKAEEVVEATADAAIATAQEEASEKPAEEAPAAEAAK